MKPVEYLGSLTFIKLRNQNKAIINPIFTLPRKNGKIVAWKRNVSKSKGIRKWKRKTTIKTIIPILITILII